MGYVLGVDASWSNSNASGVALLKCNNKKIELIRAGRSYEEFIASKINWDSKAKGSTPNFHQLLNTCPQVDVIALDIPLAPCVIEGRREADQAISRRYGKCKASTHSPTKDHPGKLAKLIFDELRESGYEWATTSFFVPAFIEVYPHVSIIEVFNYPERLQYKVREKARYWPKDSPEERNVRIISKLNELRCMLEAKIDKIDCILPKLDSAGKYTNAYLKGYEDLLDALVCALTGYFYLIRKSEAFGDSRGAIWVPKVDHIA